MSAKNLIIHMVITVVVSLIIFSLMFDKMDWWESIHKPEWGNSTSLLITSFFMGYFLYSYSSFPNSTFFITTVLIILSFYFLSIKQIKISSYFLLSSIITTLFSLKLAWNDNNRRVSTLPLLIWLTYFTSIIWFC